MTTASQPPEDKSVGAALALTFFFGPLGHLYLNVKRGVIFTLVALVVAVLTLGLGYLIIVPVAMIWAATDAGKKHTANEAWLHQRTPAA